MGCQLGSRDLNKEIELIAVGGISKEKPSNSVKMEQGKVVITMRKQPNDAEEKEGIFLPSLLFITQVKVHEIIQLLTK